jgi:hypothetical protein
MRPHSTQADRTLSLHLLGIMVLRLFKANLDDTKSSTSAAYGGFATNQTVVEPFGQKKRSGRPIYDSRATFIPRAPKLKSVVLVDHELGIKL